MKTFNTLLDFNSFYHFTVVPLLVDSSQLSWSQKQVRIKQQQQQQKTKQQQQQQQTKQQQQNNNKKQNNNNKTTKINKQKTEKRIRYNS